jgi:transcriptional regulator with XRE-family HTH domain
VRLHATHANCEKFVSQNDIDPRAIGKRLVQLRHRHEISQRQLADLLNVSERSMSDYERGVTVPWPHMRLIEQTFGVSVEWVLHGVEPGGTSDDRAARRRHAELRRQLEQLQRSVDQLAEQVRVLTVQKARRQPRR